MKLILIDIDNTLLDFDAYIRQTMEEGFAHFGLRPYEPWMYDVFHRENNKLWRQIEEGTLTFPELEKIRWNKVFAALDIAFDGTVFEKYFRTALHESAIPVEGAKELLETLPGAWIPGQFDNPANPEAHYRTTGPEIWEDTEGSVDIFVAGVGTGGTISGVGRYLKEQNPNVKIVAVEPASSPLLTQGHAGPHGLQGIGANFVPDNLDRGILDEILTVTDQDAYETGRALARREGILVGLTSGAAVWAAAELARRPENQGKTIVALLPDSGERYLSTPMFQA